MEYKLNITFHKNRNSFHLIYFKTKLIRPPFHWNEFPGNTAWDSPVDALRWRSRSNSVWLPCVPTDPFLLGSRKVTRFVVFAMILLYRCRALPPRCSWINNANVPETSVATAVLGSEPNLPDCEIETGKNTRKNYEHPENASDLGQAKGWDL